jgi:hypothetical protein
MAIKKTQQGFALLISVIFMSVMLTFGLALASLAYKQQILASNAIESQYAFYAADAALECTLYADQQQNLFDYATHSLSAPSFITSVACADSSTYPTRDLGYFSASGNTYTDSQRFSLDNGKHCADVTIYKSSPGSGKATYIFSQGYNVPCASVDNAATGGNESRLVSRGLSAHYGGN